MLIKYLGLGREFTAETTRNEIITYAEENLMRTGGGA